MHGTEKEENNHRPVSFVSGGGNVHFDPASLILSSEFAILTRTEPTGGCSDLPELAAHEALIIRKADGRATDEAVEALVLSHKLLGIKKWIVIHYIGDEKAPLFDADAADQLRQHGRFETAAHGEILRNRPAPGQSAEEWNAAWIGFWQAASRNLDDVVQTVREDVERIRRHPRTPADVEIEGYIRDLRLGRFSQV